MKTSDLRCLTQLVSVSALTLAELARGPGRANDEFEQTRRRRHPRQVEACIEAIPFDSICARSYPPVCAAVEAVGRQPRGSRAVDLMIAATALAHELPLYTLNADDLRGLGRLIEIVDIEA